MKRIIIICEGQTEQEFCQKVLARYFINKGQNIMIQAPLIKKSMGGIVTWSALKKEIETYLKNDSSVVVTTLIDYYGIEYKHEFPGWAKGETILDKNERLNFLEEAMVDEIANDLHTRFFPYLQLHEFEGLLFNDIQIFYDQVPTHELIGKDELKRVFAEYNKPEMINNSKENSPGHRLERIIKGYDKIVYGNCLAEAIGISKMREKSPRFNRWIAKLEC